jgi:hypothetical protein
MSAVPGIGFGIHLCDVFAGAAAIAGLAGVDDASLGCWSVCTLASAEMGAAITLEATAAELEETAAVVSALRLMVPIAENTSSTVVALKPHNCSIDCIAAKLVLTFVPNKARFT